MGILSYKVGPFLEDTLHADWKVRAVIQLWEVQHFIQTQTFLASMN